MLQQQSNATPEPIKNPESSSPETSHASPQQHPLETQSNTAHTIVQQPEKKRGLLGRLVKAVLD